MKQSFGKVEVGAIGLAFIERRETYTLVQKKKILVVVNEKFNKQGEEVNISSGSTVYHEPRKTFKSGF